MQSTEEKRWYLVQCKPKQDFRALENLKLLGYECLLPTVEAERISRGKWLVQVEPLFPGYLFIELDVLYDNWMPIRSTRGVCRIVRFGEKPLPVPIEIIRFLHYQRSPMRQVLQPGDRVIVDWEGTKGIEAVFLTKEGIERSLILLKILQRELQISVPTRKLKLPIQPC